MNFDEWIEQEKEREREADELMVLYEGNDLPYPNVMLNFIT